MKNRKLLAYLVTLVALVVCAIFGIDVSVGLGTLFGIYVMGNVGSKFANNTSNNTKKEISDEHSESM